MSRKRLIQTTAIIVLAVLVVFMSIGYAAYDQTLGINGTATIQQANWDIHLENPVETSNSTVSSDEITTAPTLNASGTDVTFAVTMAIGETYEFTVDVKNAGTFDAKLADYALTVEQNGVKQTLSDNVSDYSNDNISYSIKNVVAGEGLSAGSSSKKTITITATQPENSKNLPSEKITYTFNFSMYYVQN
jgi:predicted MarR family transcription regulator